MVTWFYRTLRVPALLAFAGISAGALAADNSGWAPVVSPDAFYSVETPCNTTEIATGNGVPENPEWELKPQTRVLCRTGHYFFVAGEVEVQTVPDNVKTLFDWLEAGVRNDKTAEGSPSTTTIGGRRVFINRQEDSARLAQVGFVEINKTKVVMLIGGSDGESGSPTMQDQRAAVDRFYTSIKVTGK